MRCRTGPGQEPPWAADKEGATIVALLFCRCAPGTRDGQSRFAFASLCACKAFLRKWKDGTVERGGVPTTKS